MAMCRVVRSFTIAIIVCLCALSQGASASAQSGQAKAGSDDFTSLSQRATQALDADNLDQAIPLLRKALALNPQWAKGWWSLGTSYYDQNRFAEASLAFEKVVALDPKHGTAHALLGLCLFQLGDDDAALKNIEESKELGTDNDPQLRDVIFFHEGVLLQRMGRFIAAQKPFASLCLGGNRSPQLIEVYGMAVLHMRDREFPASGSEAQQVAMLIGRGACLVAYTNYDSAKTVFTRAVKSYPDFPFVHYAFGRALVEMGDIPSAVEQFKAETRQEKGRLVALLQVAAAEYRSNPTDGLIYARKAVSLAPHKPFAHFLYGLLLVETGDYDKAVPELEIARKGIPDDPKILWALASAYGHTGHPKDAARMRAEYARLKVQKRPSATDEEQEVQVKLPDKQSGAPRP